MMAFGRVDPGNRDEQFCMTVLALKVCRRANAVSSLHGHVSREMWMPLYPGRREDHVPIGHITNGVHVNTWLAPQMRQVYERHLGADWTSRSTEPGLWQAIENVDDGELWETHQTLKARLIDFVQGVDVWLNNPRRPQEACGTSGQKVVLNGALNLSVLDGWWAEAYDGRNGFAIGMGETHTSIDRHDSRDAEALATVLREEVVRLYFDRDRDGLPREWIARMKRAIRTLGGRFSADRMVMDYVVKCYIPAAGGTSSDVSRV
jgi:glucan phosphorylase